MLPKFRNKKSFTLIEVIVVIALLAVLATIVLVVFSPTQNSVEVRNTKRRADVLEILNAVKQFHLSHGVWPPNMPASGAPAVAIKSSSTATPGNICDGSPNDVVPTYIAAFPFDPSVSGAHFTSCADYDTAYTIQLSTENQITIAAPSAEGTTISVTR